MDADGRTRCPWAGTDPRMVAYHDDEWGVPVHDDRRLFELLVLEGAQAGLSWSTILNKREGYRRAFDGFDPSVVAAYDEADVARLLADAGIVRNRAKIAAAIGTAQAVVRLQAEHGSLDAYLWGLAGDEGRARPRPRTMADLPAETEGSRAMSRELRRQGMRFVGPTIVYAFMQSCGMVDDHVQGCFRASPPG